MQKKGQITIFIILGFVLLVVFLVLFYSGSYEEIELKSPTDIEAGNFKSFIENCNEITATKGAYYIAAHNGHYTLPDDYTEEGKYVFNYVYQRSKPGLNVSLTLDEIEKNYEQYIRYNLHVCTDNFKAFKAIGADIEEGQVIADATIQTNKILVNTIYDIKVQYKDSYYEIYELEPIEIPVRLGLMYNVSQIILDWIIQKPSLISTGYINELMKQIGMNTSIDAFGTTSAYVIYDNQSSILTGVVITDPSPNNENFEYVFGAKFD